MKRYEWAPGAPFKGDAEAIQEEIDRIKKTPGGATPETLVACARSKRSVLHNLIFTVDAAEAADRYYRARAQSLLNSIRIVNEEGETTHLRANIRVQDGEEMVYAGIDEEAARLHRAAWLRGRLLNIKQELKELDLYPQVALAIDAEFLVAA